MAEPANSRSLNRVAVLTEALRTQGVTRSSIADQTGLSTATVSRVVDELIADHYLDEGQQLPRRGRGRRSTYLELGPLAGCVVGVDLGATGTRLTAVDLRGLQLGQRQLATPSGLDATGTVQWLVTHIEGLLAASNAGRSLAGVTLAVPARVQDGRQVISPAGELAQLAGDHLHAGLTTELGVPITLDSDSNLALEGEMAAGLAAGARDAVLFTLSTAVTAGIAIAGRIVRGQSGQLGRVGRLELCPGGPRLEQCLTVPGILAAADRDGHPLTDIAELADTALRSELRPYRDRFVDALVVAVSAVSVALDPTVVLFTGRTRPLISHVLPTVHQRLTDVLGWVPELHVTPPSGFSTASGAAIVAARRAAADLLDGVANRP